MDSAGTRHFFFDGDNLIAESDQNDNLLVAYDHGVTGLVSQNRGGVRSYYQLDGLGSTKELTDTGQSVTDSYSYNLAQNRTAMTDNVTSTATNYTYNNLNEMLTAGNIAFAYDLNGNTVTKTVNNQTTGYAWSAEDKLTQITHPDTQTQTFGYDGNGVRFSATDTSGTTKFVFDGSNLVAETDANNNLTTTYDYGVNGLVRQRRGADLVSYYHSDGLGSTRQLTDAQQTVTDGYTYDAWGNVAIHNPQSAIANPFQYVGALAYYKDATNGMMLLGARWYDSGVGRFGSVDPIRQRRYWHAYADGDPVLTREATGPYPHDYGHHCHCPECMPNRPTPAECAAQRDRCRNWCYARSNACEAAVQRAESQCVAGCNRHSSRELRALCLRLCHDAAHVGYHVCSAGATACYGFCWMTYMNCLAYSQGTMCPGCCIPPTG